jgi:hypothetical protein
MPRKFLESPLKYIALFLHLSVRHYVDTRGKDEAQTRCLLQNIALCRF